MLEGLACIALAVYFEARSEPLAGQMAVAQVVINRMADNRWPNEPCGVVKDGPVNSKGVPLRHRCQFSFYCDGKPETIHEHEAWRTAEEVAEAAMQSTIDITEGSLYYHTPDVNPKWRYTKTEVIQIGNHIFYSE